MARPSASAAAFRGAVLVRMTETEVELKRGPERQVLKLFAAAGPKPHDSPLTMRETSHSMQKYLLIAAALAAAASLGGCGSATPKRDTYDAISAQMAAAAARPARAAR